MIGVDSDPEAVRAAVRSQRERPWVQVQPGDIHSVVLPDAGLMRAYRGFVVERVIRNPGIGRQLARLATDAGFGSTRVVPVTSVFDDVTEADKVFGFERVTRRAVAAGYLDPQAAEA